MGYHKHSRRFQEEVIMKVKQREIPADFVRRRIIKIRTSKRNKNWKVGGSKTRDEKNAALTKQSQKGSGLPRRLDIAPLYTAVYVNVTQL